MLNPSLNNIFFSENGYPLKEYLYEELFINKRSIHYISVSLSITPESVQEWVDVYNLNKAKPPIVIDEWLTKPLVKGVAHDTQPNIFKD